MEGSRKLVIYAENPEEHAFILQQFPEIETRIETTTEGFLEAARGAEIVFSNRRYDREILVEAARGARWLHVSGTGIDRLEPLADFDPETIITNTSGSNAEIMADYVICTLLMMMWKFPLVLRNQAERRWERIQADRAEGMTMGLVGIGNVGRGVARRAAAMGMRTIGVKRSPEAVDYVDRVVGPERLHEVLAESDAVLAAAPLTQETRGMFGPAEFAVMKPTAYFINVGRGLIVQERALIAALKEGRIAGAVLDVFEREPLPPDSELWSMDDVIVTPHVSSWGKGYRERAARIFTDNLGRYLASEPMKFVVDRLKGY